jgi:hypothetical protein
LRIIPKILIFDFCNASGHPRFGDNGNQFNDDNRNLGDVLMDLKRMGILMLLCAAACAIVAYESYRFNAVAVQRMMDNASTQEMFTDLEPSIPTRSMVTGFFTVVFAVAGLKLILTKPQS